jgi:hypothetical protein
VKTRKLFFIFVIFSLILLAALTGCPTSSDDSGDAKPDPIAGLPGGTVTATATGDGFASTPAPAYLAENTEIGEPITVTVEVTDGYITNVTISGPDETANVGRPFIAKAPDIIKKQNSFRLVEKTGDSFRVLVNAVSGASYTAYGIQVAGNAAIETLKTGN